MRRGQPGGGAARAEQALQSGVRGTSVDVGAVRSGFEIDAVFRAAFEVSGEALVVIDGLGQIQWANARAREFLRMRPGMGAVSLADFFAGDVAASLSKIPAGRAGQSAVTSFDATLTTGLAVRVAWRPTAGATKHRLLCIEEGSIVQRAEWKWKRSEAEIRSILDSVRVGVLVLDSEGNVRHSNARFGQLFGLDASNLRAIETAEDIQAFLGPRFDSAAAFVAPWNSFAAGEGEPSHDELEIARPARRVIERFSRPVLDAQNRKIGWLEIYYDVTGERQLQTKLLQTEKMAALGHLVSGIAHELNNPLTAIMGYAQLLLSHGLKPDQYAEARKVFEEAERATRIVKNLLYFARENKPERTRVNLNEIVERALALRSYELKVQNIVVECALAADLPETLADSHQLQQAVLNLVVNAEQALLHSRGQGRIWIRTRRAANERIALEISDDGPGIPKEIASRIFEPFFTTKPPGVGTGLGLSIVYGIVKQHEGEVSLEHRAAGGATFVVELPVTVKQAEESYPLPELTRELVGSAVASRILVVEDEPSVAQLVVDVLREEGHHVDAVLDSQEGLTRLARCEYDLVICDLRMPRLDGPAFYDALVQAGSPHQNHIVFITGDTLAPRTARFLEESGLPYLAKPFLVEELRLAVNRRLSGRPNLVQTNSAGAAPSAAGTKARATDGRG